MFPCRDWVGTGLPHPMRYSDSLSIQMAVETLTKRQREQCLYPCSHFEDSGFPKRIDLSALSTEHGNEARTRLVELNCYGQVIGGKS